MQTLPIKLITFFLEYGIYIIPLLFGVAAALLFLTIYPKLDDKIKVNTGGYLDWMLDHMDKMFIKSNRKTCFLLLVCSTILFASIGFTFTFGLGFLNFVCTVSCAYIGWSLPKIVIATLWKKRLEKFDKQLTDALDLMANSLRSGLNLLQVIKLITEEIPAPLSQEFQLVMNQHHLGMSLEEALEDMTKRLPTEDLNMVISAILILRQTGGDLSETFSVIANTIRERRKVQGRIKAITAQGVTQATILLLLPFAVAMALHITNPDHLQPLYSNKWGYLLIFCMLGLQAIGALWLKKVVTIDV